MERLSASKLNAWLFCPGAFFEQYILGLDKYNPDLDYGKDYHKQVELYHLGQDYNADFIKHYAGTCDCSGKLAHPSYSQDFYGSPALVEKKYIHTFTHPTTGEVLQLPFSMVLDGIRPGVDLRDLKTATKPYNQEYVDSTIQATIYTYAWWQMTGELLPFVYPVVRKNPGPRTKALEEWRTARTVDDFVKFFDFAKYVIYQIMTATEYPCICRGQSHRIKGVNA